MSRRPLVALALVSFFFVSAVAIACPYCGYSPNGWGFCKYEGQAGSYLCTQYVIDPFSGRTACDLCGYCNWNDPNGSQGCGGGSGGDCGGDGDNPCDQSRRECVKPVRGDGIGWVGARRADVAIF